MGEIKTDMFPEVLRMRAKEKDGKWNRQEGVQKNTAVPAETLAESIKKGKDNPETKAGTGTINPA